MSIRDHIRILKPLPIKESVVTKIRSLTEAYDIFPKSEGEIDTLDIPHNKDNLKALLKDVLSKSDGMADPIAISKNPKEKVVKIHRLVADNLNLPALSKKYGIKVSAGYGSRGGTGTKSQGFSYQKMSYQIVVCRLVHHQLMFALH